MYAIQRLANKLVYEVLCMRMLLDTDLSHTQALDTDVSHTPALERGSNGSRGRNSLVVVAVVVTANMVVSLQKESIESWR